MKKYNNFLRRIVLYSLPFVFFGCEKEIEITEPELKEYNSIAYPDTDLPTVNKIDCYIDYSYGIAGGIRANAAFINDVKTIIDGTATFYRVGAQDNPPVIDITSIENNPATENPQKDPGSKLGVAMERIVRNKNKTSIFITDFERIENKNITRITIGSPGAHPIDVDAWGKKYFKEWLNSGNRIDVFAKQFKKLDLVFDNKSTKTEYDNWIYTIVFTPKSITQDEDAYHKSVIKRLLEKYPTYNNGVDTRHYTYTINDFHITEKNKDKDQGYLNENLVAIYYSPISNKAEYYEFESSDLKSFLGDESLSDKRVLNKFDISTKAPSLQGVVYGIKVYDITSSYSDFLTYKAQAGALPEYKTDPETGKKTLVKGGAQPFKYNKGEEVKNIFNTVYNNKTNELGLKMHDNFTGVGQPQFYQVDVVLKLAKPKYTDETTVFSLNYKNGYKINSLYKSIESAMTDATTNAQNNTLYTFFIKINP